MGNFYDDLHAPVGDSPNFNPCESSPFRVSNSTQFYLHEEVEDPFSYPELDSIFNPQNTDPLYDLAPTIQPFITTSSSTIATTTDTPAVATTMAASSSRPSSCVRSGVKDKKNKSQLLRIEARYNRALKRKNNQRISSVHEVGGDQKMKDIWAWRKYGQKFTKNSPFLRNYFKCSTLEECFAKKVVQQVSEIPEKFIVTYLGVHIHSPPNTQNPITCCYKPVRSKRCTKENRNKVSSSPDSVTNPNNNHAFAPASYNSCPNSTAFEKMISSDSEVNKEGKYMVEELGEDLFLHDDVNVGRCKDVFLDDEELFEGIDELRKRFLCDYIEVEADKKDVKLGCLNRWL